ncbi:unannotated protein [freshwater metagenome]|uniref:Unannotated protein n=1 Tax=freshwater metagenome TaxID=449393 RepID=A0A6J7JKH6_9ZZZZ
MLSALSISSSASTILPIKMSSFSALLGLPASINLTNARLSRFSEAARFLENSPSAAISLAPIANLGPVNNRINALPLSGNAKTFRVAITSATSGTCTKPPTPTTSTGIRSVRRADSISGICFRFRTNTANDERSFSNFAARLGSNQSFSKYSAIPWASKLFVSNTPQASSPRPAFALAFNSATSTRF